MDAQEQVSKQFPLGPGIPKPDTRPGAGVGEPGRSSGPRPDLVLRNVVHLPMKMLSQPDETTCGPTCLHSIYRYWGEEEDLSTVIARTRRLERGGTFAVFLACDALRQGYQATIYTYNLMVFDPTWFRRGVDIYERLQRQRAAKPDQRLQYATEGYLEFLSLGGRLRRHLALSTGNRRS